MSDWQTDPSSYKTQDTSHIQAYGDHPADGSSQYLFVYGALAALTLLLVILALAVLTRIRSSPGDRHEPRVRA